VGHSERDVIGDGLHVVLSPEEDRQALLGTFSLAGRDKFGEGTSRRGRHLLRTGSEQPREGERACCEQRTSNEVAATDAEMIGHLYLRAEMDSDERAQLSRGEGTELEKRDRAVGPQENCRWHQRAAATRTDLVVDDAVAVIGERIVRARALCKAGRGPRRLTVHAEQVQAEEGNAAGNAFGG